MKELFAYSIIVLLSLPAVAAERAIKIKGRTDAVVTKKEISLGDIAEVHSDDITLADTVVGLKKVRIAESPKPGDNLSISAYKILDALREGGVDLKKVGYSFARSMRVRRASRMVREDELIDAIQSILDQEKRDATVNEVFYSGAAAIAPGDAKFSAKEIRSRKRGRSTFEVFAKVKGEAPLRIRVDANIDEWAEVPVARHSIQRGSVVSERDLMRARLNIAAIPPDSSTDEAAIIGYEATQTIQQGDVFRNATLNIPAMIENGEKVTMVYKLKGLSATATGIAMQAGAAGDSIRIRNTSSKKILVGKVVEPGLVKVSQ